MGKTILVVGSLNMDLVATVNNLPKQGQTVFGKTFTTYPGGKGANQAVAAAKLGARVMMVGCVGKDAFGDQLVQGLDELEIDTKFIRRCDASTGTALITVNEQGANTIVVVGGANLACMPCDVEEALNELQEPGILLVQHEISEKTVNFAIEEAKRRGWVVILNPAPARAVAHDILTCVDIITPNETEASALTGINVTSRKDAEQAAEALLSLGIGTAIITMGEQGALCVGKELVHHVPAFKVKAVDTVAAGDAFSGAVATYLAEQRTLQESLIFAAKAAAISVTRYGAQPALPSREEVEKFEEMLKI